MQSIMILQLHSIHSCIIIIIIIMDLNNSNIIRELFIHIKCVLFRYEYLRVVHKLNKQVLCLNS